MNAGAWWVMTLAEDGAAFEIRAVRESDRPWVRDLLPRRWHSTRIVTRGRVHDGAELPGFVAESPAGRVGLVTWRLDGATCEIVTLDSLVEGRGIGTALVAAVRQAAIAAGCDRLWLVTTNDNLRALRFYQKRGFVLAALHSDALRQTRRIKPELPAIGLDGIPLRDEIELAMRL